MSGGFRLDKAALGVPQLPLSPYRRADSSPLPSHPRRGIVLTMKTLFQAGKDFDPVDWALGGLRGQVIAPSTDKNPFQTEGTTIKLKDGTLVHAFNLRFGEEDMSNWHAHYARTVIGKVESRDGGRTWSEPEVMFESNTGINASHPAIRRLPNGRSYDQQNMAAVPISYFYSLEEHDPKSVD